MKGRLYCFIIILCSLSSLAQKADKCITTNDDRSGSLEFIENKNQWDPRVLYKAEIGNHAIFLEKNGFTFNLIKNENISHSHPQNGFQNPSGKEDPVIHGHVYQVIFANANANPEVISYYPTTDYCNYFIGKDPAGWASNVRKFKIIEYHDLYKNINLKVYSRGSSMKYDFIINPKGNPENITLSYNGVDSIKIQEDNLMIQTSVCRIFETKPFAYQVIEGRKHEVHCHYELAGNMVKFILPDGYNKELPLVIDPGLIFSTYSGSYDDNWGFTGTYDQEGNVYSGGIANHINFPGYAGYPVSTGAYQVNFAGGDPGAPFPDVYYFGWDIGIIKYDSTGSNRLYATYLGGNSSEMPHSLVVDQNDNLLILGTTGSNNFPVTSNAYDPIFKGGDSIVYDNVISFFHGIDIFVSKLSADGSQLLASTYIGGSANDGLNYRQYYINNQMEGNDSLYFNYGDGARGEIIVDAQNNVYVGTCTFSNDFPVTNTSFQPALKGKEEGVVFKLKPDLSGLIWSSFIGGSEDDAVYSIDLNNKDEVYITGGTSSSDFPATPGSYYQSYQGGSTDGFVAHISQDGSKILNATYYGSSDYDQSYFVRTGKDNNVYIYGQTKASGSALIYNAAYNKPNSGQFIAKFKPNLDSVIWSTVFGTGNGKPNISPTAFSVDLCNRIYISGWGREWADEGVGYTWSSIEGTKNMDITLNAAQSVTDGQDFYIMVLKNDASALQYATFFGELHYDACYFSGHDHVDGGTSRFDKKGNIYQSACASCGGCEEFPTTPGAWSDTNRSFNCNNAIFKINISFDLTLANFDIPKVQCASAAVQFHNTSLGNTFTWDFGDGSPLSSLRNPTHLYAKEGTYNVTLISRDSMSCNISDTIVKQIQLVKNNISIDNIKNASCLGAQDGMISITPSGGVAPYIYIWSNGQTTSTISGLKAGIYSVTVTDQISCTADTSIVITGPIVMTDKLSSKSNTCIRACTGIATASASSGTPPYSFLWSNNQQGNMITNLCKGDYKVTITDKNNCELIDSVEVKDTINSLQKIIITDSIKNVSCFGEQDGMISISGSGGLSPYTYSWNNGQISSSITGLKEGNYSITVTDQLSCAADTTIAITGPDPLKDTISIHMSSCVLSCNGVAVASVSGGTAPYNFLWSNHLQKNVISNLCDGKYKLTITDENKCILHDSTNVKDTLANPIKINIDTVKTVTCFGAQDGVIIISATGGTAPYSYYWNNEQTSATITGLKRGSYSVTVTDFLNCSKDTTVIITEPTLLKDKLSSQPNPCLNSCNGTATASVSGGTAPYSLLWSNNQSKDIISNLCKGNYKVTISDENKCILVDSITIKDTLTQYYKFTTTADSGTIWEGATTTVRASYYSGSIYLWSPESFVKTPSNYFSEVNPDKSTVFHVMMTDPYGCEWYDSVGVDVRSIICAEPYIFVPNAFTPNGDGKNDEVLVKGHFIKTIYFAIYDRWGEKMFETDNPSTGWDGTYKGKLCDPAVYVFYLEVECTNGEKFFKKGNVTLVR